jgi:Sulfotransferase domain
LLKVIGAGFGRTGTSSLKLALETLGFRKCYHFTEMLRAWHVPRWLAIVRGAPADWDALFAGFQATTDFPAAAYYRQLAVHYPDAKVILTARDAEDWYRSMRETLGPLRRALPTWLPGFGAIAALTDAVLWTGIFDGKFADRRHAIGVYEQHAADVRARIPAHRLLVFDVREGWSPLCEFLGVAVPADVEFPHVNDTAYMVRLTRLLRAAHWSLVAALVALAAFLLYSWLP